MPGSAGTGTPGGAAHGRIRVPASIFDVCPLPPRALLAQGLLARGRARLQSAAFRIGGVPYVLWFPLKKDLLLFPGANLPPSRLFSYKTQHVKNPPPPTMEAGSGRGLSSFLGKSSGGGGVERTGGRLRMGAAFTGTSPRRGAGKRRGNPLRFVPQPTE